MVLIGLSIVRCWNRTRQMGNPRKAWWDDVKESLRSFGLSQENALYILWRKIK